MFRKREEKREKIIEEIINGDYVFCADGTTYEVLFPVKNTWTNQYEVILKNLGGTKGELCAVPMKVFLKEKADLAKYPDYPQTFLFEKIRCVEGKWKLAFPI